jgi:hypothetical protein
MTNNWIELKAERKGGKIGEWVHRNHINLRVIIRLNSNPRNPAKYFVQHYHPGPEGHVILQNPEYVNDLITARKKVAMHLKHWNDPKKWTKDPDYGKLTNKP